MMDADRIIHKAADSETASWRDVMVVVAGFLHEPRLVFSVRWDLQSRFLHTVGMSGTRLYRG